MTKFEQDVIDRLGRIETKLDADWYTLYGNGKPGLVDKVATVEDRLRDIENEKKLKRRHYGVITAVVGFIINAIGVIYAIIKKST